MMSSVKSAFEGSEESLEMAKARSVDLILGPGLENCDLIKLLSGFIVCELSVSSSL